jgi:hypothetical protein
MIQSRRPLWAVAFLLLVWGWAPGRAVALDALVLSRDAPIHETPHATSNVIKTARAGETYEFASRKSGKTQPLYLIDERGVVWVKIRLNGEGAGFVRNDLIAVSREEYRSPRGNPLLIVNLRVTADGSAERDLWLIQEGWRGTKLIGEIDGRPVWASHGEWFICQVDSNRPIKDQSVDRTLERIERHSADGRTRTLLAAGTYPVLNEARGEVYFYRDLDDQGDAVPPGLFAVNVDGGNLRPIYLLPERYKFWKEDGDFFVQVPAPVLHAGANRIALYAYEPHGTRVRITVSLEGQFLELRRD